MSARQPYVFVTYVTSDFQWVRLIVDELEKLHVRTWVDWKNLQPGEPWEKAIRIALNGARAVVFFVSSTKDNEGVVADLAWVAATGIPVVAVFQKARAIPLPAM